MEIKNNDSNNVQVLKHIAMQLHSDINDLKSDINQNAAEFEHLKNNIKNIGNATSKIPIGQLVVSVIIEGMVVGFFAAVFVRFFGM
jgi:uncharacterized protein YoxC